MIAELRRLAADCEDAAFGIFARVLGDGHEYAWLKKQLEGIELADSITVDGHKMLNVVSTRSVP